MNEKLKKLGFEANRIIETILLIKAREKIKNSPIGVKLDKNQLLTATIYKTNQIYKNIKKHSVASLNITNKAKLFYDSVFNKKLKTNGLRLEKSHYTIKGEIIELKKQKNYLIVKISPNEIEKNNEMVKGYCRANSAIIEALIYYTKLGYKDKKYILNKIKEAKKIVQKTGSEEEKKLMKKIVKNIK